MARYEYLSREMSMPAEPMDVGKCLRACAKLMREVGEAAREIESAAEDGELDMREVRRIQREISDVINVCFDILSKLSAALDAGYEKGRTRSGHS
jgi:NTP pyrophosphatase (non-canonical NTP hydrolase)